MFTCIKVIAAIMVQQKLFKLYNFLLNSTIGVGGAQRWWFSLLQAFTIQWGHNSYFLGKINIEGHRAICLSRHLTHNRKMSWNITCLCLDVIHNY